MDPISTLLVGHATGKLLDKFGSSFRTHVIDRWTRRRGEEFFEQFCKEVSSQKDAATPRELDEELTKLLEDEACSEILFDAYRRVALSKSKILGPRIIAILTAEIVTQGRVASDTEDTIFAVAENLLDDELTAFARFVREEQTKSGNVNSEQGLRIKCCEEQIDSNWSRRQSISTGPLDLDEWLGIWGRKMKSYGIIRDDVQERQFNYEEDSERHIDEPGTIREISWWISIPAQYFKLVDLVCRAGGDVAFIE